MSLAFGFFTHRLGELGLTYVAQSKCLATIVLLVNFWLAIHYSLLGFWLGFPSLAPQ